MRNVSTRTDIDKCPVLYAGRFADRIADVDLPNDYVVLGEQDALPHTLTVLLNRANALVLLDLPSFPLEAMNGAHWDIPIVVALPPGFGTESLTATFGSVLFKRLGFFDRIVTPDSALW